MIENPFRTFRDHDAETTGKSGGRDKPKNTQTESDIEVPRGVKTKTSLAGELGVSRDSVELIAEKYRSSNPEYFQNRQTKKISREYYSPELVAIIIKEINEYEKAPEGWKTNGNLSKEFNVANPTILKIVLPYRQTNPDYFKQYKEAKMGRLLEHYSPELNKIIGEKLVLKQEAPAGWKNNSVLANEIGIDASTLAKIADIYREKKEYFAQYKNKANQISEYYSPKLVLILTNEIKKNENAPEGWKTNTAVAAELSVSRATLANTADTYRENNPQYFKNYRDGMGRVNEHYSPDFIEILRQEMLKREFAPDGWMVRHAAATELNISTHIFSNLAASYRASNPDYFKNFKDEAGNLTEHYSQELIELLRQEISLHEEVPDGWKTIGTLCQELDTNYPIIDKIAEEYRQNNPDYFKSFQGRKYEYLSPDFVKIIAEKVNKFNEIPDAPVSWKTIAAISHELKTDRGTIEKIVKKYKNNLEYFHDFKDKAHKVSQHLSPELIGLIKLEVEEVGKNKEIPLAPEGWKTKTAFSEGTEADVSVVSRIAEKYRESNPEYFGRYKSNDNGRVFEYYSPELLAIITTELQKYERAPSGWVTNEALSIKVGVSRQTVRKIADKYREDHPSYFKNFKDESGGIYEHYSPELLDIIQPEINEFKNTPEAPEGWKTNKVIAGELYAGQSTIEKLASKYRESNPEYFKSFKTGSGSVHEYYSPELIQIISNEIQKHEVAPVGWKTNSTVSGELKADFYTLVKMAEKYRNDHPEYFMQYKDAMNRVGEHYSPELINLLSKDIEQFKNIESAPIGWLTNRAISSNLNIGQLTVTKMTAKYRVDHPEYFKQYKDKMNRVNEHYSPDLVEIIKNELASFVEQKGAKEQEEKLKSDLENLAEDISNPETANETARKIAEIIRLLPGNAHDIIIKYHPRYKGLHPDYVKQVIADYLGDFMLPKNEWHPSDVQKLKDVMDIEGIQEEILINLKNGCLTFVNNERKNDFEISELALVEAYFEKEAMLELAGSGIKEVENAILELREYYDAIFRLRDKKPGNVIDTLREGRTFPDINQLVNIREIAEKKKMLIADEMGLGKSASAILTKEYLGLGCALVVMPSNVEDTWKKYLSDGVNEQGKKIGYFKEGFAPKVLTIESVKDLERLKKESFDYVLVSQEKISGEQYGNALEQVDFDMMIVDEVHKLKNIESGVRSQAVESLSNKISGENKYLALLSGTPVPNKVKDIAITLKLLYPEKYKDFDSKEMVKRILYGDLIDLRSELLKRMQMKELASSIEMPKLTEKDIVIDLIPEEREIYEILLEEDELTALDKILIFRQFLLNPEILKVEPGFVGSKIKKLEETLQQDLETQNKIVVFVNGYVEGTIKGENNIIQKLNLPEGTIIEEIHGDISHAERTRIQNELKSGEKKTVVFVSGQTADVGVDFSGADGMIFYNEPWSKYEKKQQQGRVYREGLKNDLTVKTLITKDSIEEGIRAYITAKEKAIEKLLKGISNTEAEKKLLHNDSKLVNNDIETNAQLSKEYLSDWEKLMLHFGEGYESGEKRFRQELTKTGKEYADLYKKLGRLTYQGNNARVSATLIERMIEERKENISDIRILDVASGPEMLKEASNGEIRNHIFSSDINIEHFTASTDPEKTISASYLNLPVKDGSLDYVNLGFAFHQTSPIKYHKKNYERLQVLAEMNRALKPGGRTVISMLHNVQFANIEKFEALVEQLGFKIVSEYTGEAKGKESYKAGIFTLEKTDDIPEYKSDALKFDSADNAKYITALGDKLGREFLQGLEMSKTLKGKSRLRDQRRMIDKVTLGGKEIEIIFNGKDRALLDEEVQSIQDGEDLRTQYGEIQNIPIEEIKRIGFERKLETPGYYLLYKIIKDGGAVIIRGDYKTKVKNEKKEN